MRRRAVANIWRYQVVVVPCDGETVADAKARLDAQGPLLLANAGAQIVGEATNHYRGPRDEVIRHDRPGDEPAPYPFRVVRLYVVTDTDVPAQLARRLDPTCLGPVLYNPDLYESEGASSNG